MILLGAPPSNCRALVMLCWDAFISIYCHTCTVWGGGLKSRTFVLSTAAFNTVNSILFPQDGRLGGDRWQRVQSKQNKSVCLSAGWAVLCSETQDKECSMYCWNVPALHLQSLKLTKQEKRNWLKRSHKHWQQARSVLTRVTPSVPQSRNFQRCRFLKFRGWHSPAVTPVLPHCHSGTAHQGHSHVPLPNPPLPTCLQARKFQNKAQRVMGWLVCLGNVIFPIWCTVEEWAHLQREGNCSTQHTLAIFT